MDELKCNNRKCRKRLSTFAWVTSCSHIFCDEDGSRAFNKTLQCPACQNNLSSKYDVLRIDLQLTEQYKSMLLAGQRPDVALEVSSRSLAFWTYQTQQELAYQDYVVNKSKEKTNQMELYYEQVINKMQTENNSLKSDLSAKTREVEETKKRFTEISEKLVERNKQYQKLQGMYDSLRRKMISPSTFDDMHTRNSIDGSRIQLMRNNFDIPIGAASDILRRSHTGSMVDLSIRRSPPQRDFVFRINTDIIPQAAQAHPSTRDDETTLQSRFLTDFDHTHHLMPSSVQPKRRSSKQ